MNNREEKCWAFITWFGGLGGSIIFCSILIALCGYLVYTHYMTHGILVGATSIHREIIVSTIIACVGLFLSYSIGTFIKYFHHKPRPVARDTSSSWKKINAGSMPSIHSSNAIIMAFALFPVLISSLQLGGKSAFIVIFGCLVYYVSIALSRIALRHHYPIDVLAGTLLGIAIILFLLGQIEWIIRLSEKLIYLLIP